MHICSCFEIFIEFYLSMMYGSALFNLLFNITDLSITD